MKNENFFAKKRICGPIHMHSKDCRDFMGNIKFTILIILLIGNEKLIIW
jgi:hypothetical protein